MTQPIDKKKVISLIDDRVARFQAGSDLIEKQGDVLGKKEEVRIRIKEALAIRAEVSRLPTEEGGTP